MTLALAVVAVVALGSQDANPELSDGFYCSTDQYFAYETLLHDSADAHLLHVVPLTEATRQPPELKVAVPAAPTRGIRCTATEVLLRSDREVTKVTIDTRPWSASRAQQTTGDRDGAWVTTRLWGHGTWSRSATERTTLRAFRDGSSASLEIYRLSNETCMSRVGSRLAWRDSRGRETRSQPLFYRWPSCRASSRDDAPPEDPCAATNGRVTRRLHGRVSAGQSYRRTIAPFVFKLVDEGRYGWTIVVTPQSESRDLTSLLPLHGLRGQDIQPFDDRTPATYPFSFHPEARRGITYSDDTYTNLINDIRIESYGRGRVTVQRQATEPGADGRPQFRWVEFDACLSWPR